MVNVLTLYIKKKKSPMSRRILKSCRLQAKERQVADPWWSSELSLHLNARPAHVSSVRACSPTVCVRHFCPPLSGLTRVDVLFVYVCVSVYRCLCVYPKHSIVSDMRPLCRAQSYTVTPCSRRFGLLTVFTPV